MCDFYAGDFPPIEPGCFAALQITAPKSRNLEKLFCEQPKKSGFYHGTAIARMPD
jgi:hypothetical protein